MLALNANRLVELPPCLTALVNLTELRLDDNLIAGMRRASLHRTMRVSIIIAAHEAYQSSFLLLSPVPPALRAGTVCLFEVLDFYWSSAESVDLWYNSRQFDKTI